MNTKIKEWTEQELDEYNKCFTSRNFIIPDPNEELTEIYFISTFTEIMDLWAERDGHLPEAKQELGNQNPDYTKFVNLMHITIKKATLSSFKDVYEWVIQWLEQNGSIREEAKITQSTVVILTGPCPDVRLAHNLDHCMTALASYLYSTVLNKLNKCEGTEEKTELEKHLREWKDS